jgi:hypothetical protein
MRRRLPRRREAAGIMPRPATGARLRLALGLARAGMFYALHPAAPLPGKDGNVILPIRLPRTGHGSKLTALFEVASKLGTTEQAAPLDCTTARREFGPVAITATVQGAGYTMALARLPVREPAQQPGRHSRTVPRRLA